MYITLKNIGLGWLCEANKNDNNVNEAFCKICKSFLRAHQTDLKKHSNGKTHIAKMKMIVSEPSQSKISNIIIITNEQKEIDLKLALYVVTHSSIRNMDHLIDILKSIGKGSPLSNLKMHRTKCSNLIKNVIGPSLLENVVNDCNGNPFSLIIDESTDVSVVKYLCLCIKYFSIQDQKIKIQFLGLIEVEKCTADLLYEHICKYIEHIGLNLINLVGIGTDGASNLCGRNHSLFTLLRQQNPNLQIVRCICHSLNNAISKAADVFPSHIDFICREVLVPYKSIKESRI